MATATAVGGPNVPQTEANPPGGMVPFRRATTFRTSMLPATGPQALTAAQQQVQVVLDGSGYIYQIDLHVVAVAAGNAAAVAYLEDAPYSAIAANVLGDVNGDLINLDGFNLYLTNLYCGYTNQLQNASLDPLIWNLVAGAAANGGSFAFHLKVPVGLNRRSLLGIVANQDRAQKYSLRSDIAPAAAIYGVAPTNLPAVTINRTYENYAVPAGQNAAGASQQQQPNKLGVLHFLTQSVNATAPAPGTQNHYLPRLGNTIRTVILVLRSNGTRAAAEAALPTQISFLLGDTPIFTETPAYRRALMYDRYGFDAPAGVFVYDWITDVVKVAGDEMGDDYAFTNGLVNAQFAVNYPAAFGAVGNSLMIITDDLQIPSNVDIYSAD
jgi:hypothetical protein